MKDGSRRILALATCLIMSLSSCGIVEQFNPSDPLSPGETQTVTLEATKPADDDGGEETVSTAVKSSSGSKHTKTTAANDSSKDTVTTAKVYAPPAEQDVRTHSGSSSNGGGGNSHVTPSQGGGHSGGGSSSGGNHSGGSSSQHTTPASESKSTTTAKTTDTDVRTTTTVTTAEPLPKNATPDEMLAAMSLRQKVYQMFIVDPEHLTGTGTVTSAGETMKDALAEYPVGGVILFAANLESKEQTKQLLADMQAFSEVGLFTAVDEEGGTVARCAQKLGTTSFSNMASYGEFNDSDTAYNIGETLGIDLKDLGFNLDFAPVADTWSPEPGS